MELTRPRALKELRILLFWLFFGLDALALGVARPIQENDSVVLRDLSIVRDVTVSDFDESGLTLSNGARLRWDEILLAKAPSGREAEFDKRLTTGETLYRLKTRLRIEDWTGAGALAETFYQGIRSSVGAVAEHRNREFEFVICLSVMKGRLLSGNRAGAVEPFLVAAAIQNDLADADRVAMDSLLLPSSDAENFMSSQIIPHWFDPSHVAELSDRLTKLSEEGRFEIRKGAAIYLASMAVSVKDYSKADRIISRVKAENGLSPELRGWLRAVEIERYLSAGEPDRADPLFVNGFDGNSNGPRALVYFLRGRYVEEGEDRQLLSLLTVPALFGDRFPNLSSSALYHATIGAERKGNSKEARILGNELLRRYPNTYHGRLQRADRH